jgi:hypothetical protein
MIRPYLTFLTVMALTATMMLLSGCEGSGSTATATTTVTTTTIASTSTSTSTSTTTSASTTTTTTIPATIPATATGKFVDAPVEGLKYVSGAQNGFTGPTGEFTYEVGQSVIFSVGGVVVGQAQGSSVMTPIELVKSANPSATVTADTPAVVQIARFLLTASSLTSTGIKIDPIVTAACATQNINISTAPASSFSAMISQIATLAGNRNITTTTDAQNHITASMNGLSSGILVLPPASSTGGGDSTSPRTSVTLYISAGSVQCATGGMSLTGMQRLLTDAGIQVLTANCGSDGRIYTTVCGGPDGRIGIFEIPAVQAQAASALGFAPLSALPDASKIACQ